MPAHSSGALNTWPQNAFSRKPPSSSGKRSRPSLKQSWPMTSSTMENATSRITVKVMGVGPRSGPERSGKYSTSGLPLADPPAHREGFEGQMQGPGQLSVTLRPNVGASLLAKAVGQSAMMSPDTRPSRVGGGGQA